MTRSNVLRYRWGPAFAIKAVALMALGVLVTNDAWLDILTIAMTDEESSHIFLVPIVLVWLVWVRRGRLRQCRQDARWVGPLVVAAGWLMCSIGYHRAVQAFVHGGSVLVVVGCLLTVSGAQLVRHFLPAFVLLVFLVPVPGMVRLQIALPLQDTTAQVTHTLLQVLGIPVALSGNVLEINGAQVSIAEACNGLRMVFALVLVSYAFAFGTPLRWYVRAIIMAASPVSAIACNVMRTIPTVWFYGYTSNEFATQFHDVSGWIMLIASFLILMGIIHLLRWALVPVTRYTLAYD